MRSNNRIITNGPSARVTEIWRESAREEERRLQRDRAVHVWWGEGSPGDEKVQRAREASEFVAQMLREKEPGLAAILDTEVRDLS